MRVTAVLLLVRGAAAANGTRVRGHGFSFDATAVLERRALPVNGSWRVRQHARARLKKPTQLTVVECRNASVPLYADNIWGCGRRSPAARQWQRREWILCGAKALPNAVVVPGRTHLGVDLFSPTFQHEMINGVQQLAGVWPRFVNDTESRPVRKSTSELGFVNLHAIEPTRSRRQHRVDGVGPRRCRADAATETTSRRWRGAPEISTQVPAPLSWLHVRPGESGAELVAVY